MTIMAGSARAAALKVDFRFPGRNDTIDPHYTQWMISDAVSVSRTFDGVTVTFSKTGSARRAVSGLSARHHSIATYRNTYDNPLTNTFSNIGVSLNGSVVRMLR